MTNDRQRWWTRRQIIVFLFLEEESREAEACEEPQEDEDEAELKVNGDYSHCCQKTAERGRNRYILQIRAFLENLCDILLIIQQFILQRTLHKETDQVPHDIKIFI